MALTERTIIDKLEVYPDGSVGVREAREVLRDGVVIAKSHHRHRIDPADDTPDLSVLDPVSVAVVEAARSPERRAAAKARREAATARASGAPGLE